MSGISTFSAKTINPCALHEFKKQKSLSMVKFLT